MNLSKVNCSKCRNEIEIGYCRDCYLKIHGELLGKVMEGSSQMLFSEIRDLCWKLEDKIISIEKSIEEIRDSLVQFKIRGFKLKSKKEKSDNE